MACNRFLHDIVGETTIKNAVKKPLNGLKLATHYGCHILRPSTLKTVDDPENPKKLDELIEWLGAKSMPYPEKLDCCGAMLLLSHPDAAFTFSGLKMKAVQERGSDGLVVTCPSCQNMFDMRQKSAAATTGAKLNLPVLYYTQLLGLAMGIQQKKLSSQGCISDSDFSRGLSMILIWPPSEVNLTAFERRLSSTAATATGSVHTGGMSLADSQTMKIFFRSAIRW
jgi:heterodisulfide reductase subunit B